MSSNVLPIIEIRDRFDRTHYINAYQIVSVLKTSEVDFQIRVNNQGPIECNGDIEEFINSIKKSK